MASAAIHRVGVDVSIQASQGCLLLCNGVDIRNGSRIRGKKE